MATTRIMSLHIRADPPGGGTLIFPPFQRAAGPTKKRSAGTRSQPRHGAVQRVLGALPPTSRLDLPLTAGGPILHRGSHDALLAGTLKGGKLLRLIRVCGGVAPRGKLY